MKQLAPLLSLVIAIALAPNTAHAWQLREFSGVQTSFQGVNPAEDTGFWFSVEGHLMRAWPLDDYNQDYYNDPVSTIWTMNTHYYPGFVSVRPGESWKLGTLEFRNMSAADSPGLLLLDMTIDVNGTEWSDEETPYTDPGTEFWEQDIWRIAILQDPVGPDALYLPDFPSLGALYVPEGVSGQVDLYAAFGSIDPVLLVLNPNSGSGTSMGSTPALPEGGSLLGLLALTGAALCCLRRTSR